MLKAVNILKVLSALIFLGVLLLVYAYLPVMVRLNPEDPSVALHRETFFYAAMSTFIALNVLVYIIQKIVISKISGEPLQAWISGFTFVINLYLSFLVGYIGVYNNPASISPDSYAYLNFLGPILIIGWIAGLIFLIFRKS